MKMIILLILLTASASLARAADTIISPDASTMFLKDSTGNLLPASIGYTTDGNGVLKLINSPGAVDDTIVIPKDSGKAYLQAASGAQYPASVLYTTDGNGHVIPIPAGGGGGSSTWGSITGTLSSQTDLQTALNAKQASLSFTSPLVNSSNTVSIPLATSTVNGYLQSTDFQAFEPAGYNIEFHVFPGYTGATQNGSFNQPYTTLQAAINAAQSFGAANATIYLHGPSTTENVTINNYAFNLLIESFGSTAVDNQTFIINGNVTISGSSTRIRLKDIKIQYPGGTQPDLIDSSAGRNYFSNVGFEGGGGIQFSGSWARWHEFTDCTISGPVSIGGTPTAGSTISTWRVRGGGNYTLNAANASLMLYDSFSVGNVVQTAGPLTIDGGRGFVAGSTITSTTNSGSDLLQILNVSLQTGSSSFAQINKTGTAPYILSNVFRNETGDTLTGTRLVQGSSAADEKYVPTTPATWATAPGSVLAALDFLAPASRSFVGDTGTGGVQGIVPAPTAGQTEQGAYLSSSGAFALPDVSKPIFPSFSLIENPASPTQKLLNALIIQNGSSTYAIGGGGTTDTVSIYNVTNQAAPVLRSAMQISGTYGVCGSNASWPYIFVPASGARTLTILNISNPAVPVVTATFSWAANTTSIYGCAYDNGLVFLAGQNHGLGILDVGNGVSGGTITVPVLAFDEGNQSICSVTNSCKSFGVAVDIANKIVYSSNFSTATPWTYRQLKAYSYASSITAPTLLQNLTLPANTKAGAITLNLPTKTAFVTDTNQMLIDVVDITNVSTGGMSVLSTLAPVGGKTFNAEMSAIFMPGSNYVYVPGGGNTVQGGLDMYYIGNRSSPKFIATTLDPLANNVFGSGMVDPRGGYIYVGSYGTGSSGSAMDIFTMPSEILAAGQIISNSVIGTVSYTPAVAANWAVPPASVQGALDQLIVTQQSAVGAQPACSSTNRGLQWLIQSASGTADIFQICQQTVSGFAWVTH